MCLDVGNTQIHGGVYDGNKLKVQFRKTSRQQLSSDEFGLFVKSVLRENGVDPGYIKEISICCVVPDMLHSIRSGCIKYFEIDPFVLKAGVKTGLDIKYKNPSEVGADRIANAVAAVKLYPNKNIIIIDFGTATTFDVVSKKREYLGGAIVPGVRISMESLVGNTAKLPRVEIQEPETAVGKTTIESIQSGLYYGQIGMIKELIRQITIEAFQGKEPVVIATGGFASLFDETGLFEIAIPILVLQGLNEVLKLNKER
jgi:type III pantothenate kinase